MNPQASEQTPGIGANGSANTDSVKRPKPSGTTFDLVRKLGETDGKAQWEKLGTLFLRGNGTGGVVYLKLGDQELQVAVFPKRPRK